MRIYNKKFYYSKLTYKKSLTKKFGLIKFELGTKAFIWVDLCSDRFHVV